VDLIIIWAFLSVGVYLGRRISKMEKAYEARLDEVVELLRQHQEKLGSP
jgi:hypothetical protein